MWSKGSLYLVEEDVAVGVASAQGVERDLVGAQVQLAAHEAAAPRGFWAERFCQQGDLSLFIGAAHEDDFGFQEAALGQDGWGGKRPACGCGLLTDDGLVSIGLEILVGALEQTGSGPVLATIPDLFLPEGIEALDLVLEAMFSRDSKDGNHAQAQTLQSERSESAGMMVRSMETQIVIELGIMGQPVHLPVLVKVLASFCGGDGGIRPSSGQSAVEGDGRKDLNVDSSADDKVFDDIKRIQFRLATGHGRQVPTRWRRGSADSALVSNQPMMGDDARDSSLGRHGASWSVKQKIALNSRRANLAEDTMLKLRPQFENLSDDRCRSGIGGVVGAGDLVFKADPIQSLTSRAADPILDGKKPHVIGARKGAQGLATASGLNDFTAQLGRNFFMSRTIACRHSPGCVAAALGSLRSPSQQRRRSQGSPPQTIDLLMTDQLNLSLK